MDLSMSNLNVLGAFVASALAIVDLDGKSHAFRDYTLFPDFSPILKTKNISSRILKKFLVEDSIRRPFARKTIRRIPEKFNNTNELCTRLFTYTVNWHFICFYFQFL